MNTVVILAQKEIRDGLRNRWVAVSIALLTLLSLSLYLLGSAATGVTGADSLTVTVVSLVSLGVYLLPLIALMLSFDALVGEFERGTMLLLAAYPVARWQIVVGKFVGHMVILLLAILISCGSVALLIVFSSDASGDAWIAYAVMMASSWLLGGVFIALGYLISVLVRERATAVGAAVAVWLALVVLYDLLLLGALVADEEQVIGEQTLIALLLANPTDAFRLFNLTATEQVTLSAGLADVAASAGINAVVPLLLLGAWVVAALSATIMLLYRREF